MWHSAPLMLLMACGYDKPTPKPTPKPYVSPSLRLTKDAPASNYFIADPGCQRQASTAPITIQSTTIHSIMTDPISQIPAVSQHLTDLTNYGLAGEPFIKGRYVSAVTYGDQFERVCDNGTAAGGSCQNGGYAAPWHQIRNGSNLKICTPNMSFDRYSYEGIALNVTYFIEKTLQTIAPLFTGPIGEIAIEVVPQYVSLYPENSQSSANPATYDAYFFVHNMAYFPPQQKITVFPESMNLQPYYEKYGHLWESPFAVAHEVGHHIEQQMLHNSSSFINSVTNPPWYDPSVGYQNLLSENNLSRSTAYLLRNALSEGFADLVGFYSVNEDSLSVRGLMGLGLNRDPADPMFHFQSGAAPKILTQNIENKLRGSDGSNDAVSSYTIGSIFSYTINHAFDRVAQESLRPYRKNSWRSDSATALKFRLIFLWFNAYIKDAIWQTSDRATREYIQATVPALTTAIDRTLDLEIMPHQALDELKSNLCRDLQTQLPTIVPPYFNTATHSC